MNTLFLLMAEFGSADIPLNQCCDKYFGINPRKAVERARLQQLPVPAYRGGSQKSQWLVSAADLAGHIDKRRAEAQHDWKRLNG
ncbi:pyocin activator PrtN family protein [Microbulbifer sp. ALW1]|uniref:pyocin activator PrtN family protein n=1 Tax=Microbulbifer sp. (strain ALW1) TaxID=1516059 RepID=UPI00135A3BB5|nr:pyocin activator PrtN family protein [Microbulbifer sp. ALW1]